MTLLLTSAIWIEARVMVLVNNAQSGSLGSSLTNPVEMSESNIFLGVFFKQYYFKVYFLKVLFFKCICQECIPWKGSLCRRTNLVETSELPFCSPTYSCLLPPVPLLNGWTGQEQLKLLPPAQLGQSSNWGVASYCPTCLALLLWILHSFNPSILQSSKQRLNPQIEALHLVTAQVLPYSSLFLP